EPLRGLGYSLLANSFIEEEGISYDVMKWVKEEKSEPYGDLESLFGPYNLKNKPEAWVKFWTKEKNRLEAILNTSSLPEDKRSEYSRRIETIKEALDEN
ncbi:MAG: tRNA (adenine(22)-N(1))-methyltransferase TrmK, partial [Bacilli bacterium]|nr:tRNA (adenine(22)-N(1))-methyltransferase TrmK [Bacilli bacterium]